MTLPLWARVGKIKLANNSPTILSGLAVGGLVATVALAVRATSKAVIAIDRARDDKEYKTADSEQRGIMAGETRVPLTKQEIIESCWKFYIPAGITGAATIACVIGANQIGIRKQAAMAGAYALAETAFREYKDEVVKQLGANKERKVEETISERKIQQMKPDAQVIITGGGDQLCFDEITGRYFRSDADKIRRAELELKATIFRDMFVDHNAFYSLLGLEDVLIGEALGWNIEHVPEIRFSSHLAPDGTPCLSVRFTYLPKVDYLKY